MKMSLHIARILITLWHMMHAACKYTCCSTLRGYRQCTAESLIALIPPHSHIQVYCYNNQSSVQKFSVCHSVPP